MKEIIINITEYELFDIANCITYDNTLFNKLHDAHIKIEDKIHLIVEDTQLWCNILVEDIEYGDGDYLGKIFRR